MITESNPLIVTPPETDLPLVDESQASVTVDASIDPLAGGILNGKPILSAEQVAAHLNRTGAAFTDKPTDAKQSDADNSVINYGFHANQGELFNNGYTYISPVDGVRYGVSEYFNFTPFSEAQKAAVREAMSAWDDIVSVSFAETNSGIADINFGNLTSAPTTQAYATLPFDKIYANDFVNEQMKERAGDVWVSLSQASNLRLDEGQYGIHTLVHEVGHSLGLSHPGAYNAAPGVSITYPVNAEYAQDTRAYSVMSYFEASSISGTRHFDFHTSGTVYAATPLVHDIAAAQRIYGADMTTRTGDTVYGFNSNAGRDSYDFTKTPAPIMAIWDAGGTDTIDASGYATDQIIDLAPGSLSSIGGVTYDTAPSFEQVNANRAANNMAPVPLATYTANMAALLANPVVGRLTNNVGIAYGAIIENAIGGSGHDSLLGNSVANVLTGNGGNDILGGGAGDDTLDGGTGNDTMLGGIGNDLFRVDAAGDVVTELAGEGTDTVSSTISYALTDQVENLVLTGAATDGTGNSADNAITGNGEANRLDGGAGNDTLAGGNGDDLYIVDAAGDLVVELGGEGVDTVSSAIDYTLGANVENLVLNGAATNGTGNGAANAITGNELANRLDGGAGNDTLAGGNGDDLYIVDAAGDLVVELGGEGVDTVSSAIDYTLGANVENLVLNGAATNGTGNGAANAITGNELANRLDGGAGNDTLAGGNGDDLYIVDAAGDLVVELGGEGVDTVSSAIDYTLGANVENLVLTGAATNGTGNGAANVITGNELANRLDGGAGNDTLAGGNGDDLYIVDAVGDLVVEVGGEGVDTVESSVSYALADQVENLILAGLAANGTGNALDNVITGNAEANRLDGGAGNDTLAGGIGDDLYIVDAAGDVVVEIDGEGTDTVASSIDYLLGDTVENLVLTGSALVGTGNGSNNAITGNDLGNTLNGGAGNDRLDGAAGNDMLNGGIGNDTMLGGTGNDRFIVNASGDIVTELAGEGTDTVESSISLTLADHVENLILTGDATHGTGNGLDNVIIGNDVANHLNGGAGNDTLRGGDGRDFFTGGSGADVFIGEINASTSASRSGLISLDVITDFQRGSDIIDLRHLDANLSLAHDQAFKFNSTNANKNAGDLTYKVYTSVNGAENALGMDIDGQDGPSSYTGPVTVVYGNVDGGAADFAIVLLETNGVSAGDFFA